MGTQNARKENITCGFFSYFQTLLKRELRSGFAARPLSPKAFSWALPAGCRQLWRRSEPGLCWHGGPAARPRAAGRGGPSAAGAQSCDGAKMAAGEPCAAAGMKEDFEIIDKTQVPDTAELKNVEKEKEEAKWSAPILSLAKKASENLALSYGSALKSAASVGLISKAVSNDSTAKTSMAMSI